MVRIALYSEDRELQRRLSQALGGEYEVLFEQAETGVCQLLDANICSVCILHLSAAFLKGRLDFSRQLIASQSPLIVAADPSFESTALQLVRLGAKGHFSTGGDLHNLAALLRDSIGTQPIAKQPQSPRRPLRAVTCGGLIGSSAVMQSVSYLVKLVADLDVSVFVTGESGTGKELIARAIHSLGNRSSQPFVAVSCGAIPDTLFEAELFGHEKGAFTGTVGYRQGHFEEAGSGTLFLDEIGDLSLPAQVKLLRVLQQREFSRLGSNRLIPLRARVVFATHQDLEEMVAQGTFRQDLFYRINVVRINAPALREHPEDIPQLVAHFLQLYSQMYDMPSVEIDSQALSILQTYSWPGNVRELEHVIQSSMILCRGEVIHADVLPNHIQATEANVVNISNYQSEGSFEKQLTNYKIRLATEAVRRNNGNKTVAARSLNISRAYLHRLLRLGGEEQLSETDCSEVEAI
jgi:DNA-binding NtrC family response regulator